MPGPAVDPAKALALLQKLEDYFSSPEFTSAVGEFLSSHSHAIEFVAQEAEQPLQNHEIFQQYTSVVEHQLEKWLAKESLSPQEVYTACQYAHSSGEASWLTCIDYLLASTEYETFMELVYDHYLMSTSTVEMEEDAEAWAPGAGDGDAAMHVSG